MKRDDEATLPADDDSRIEEAAVVIRETFQPNREAARTTVKWTLERMAERSRRHAS